MAVCAKCRRCLPSAGDTWCLGCSGWEALGAELGFAWSHPGLRVVAHDIVVSAVRQIRALRVTRAVVPGSQAARGSERPRTPERGPRAGTQPEPREPRAPTLPRSRVEADEHLEEKQRREEESSYLSEEEDSGAVSEATIIQDKAKIISAEGLSAKAAPAPKSAVKSEEIEIEEKKESAGNEAGPETVPEVGERATSSKGPRPQERHQRRHRRGREGQRKEKKKRKRDPTHRAGRKHPRLYRADANPFAKVHRRLDSSYLDFDPNAPAEEAIPGSPPRAKHQ